MAKTEVTLGGVEIAANSSIVWKFTTGTRPYITVLQVHKDRWNTLKGKAGEFLDLVVKDARGVTTTIKKVSILHQVPSDSPHRIAFYVADLRWKWAYKLLARDYNIARRTGKKTALDSIPIETANSTEEFFYLAYSLKDGKDTWKAKEAVKDALHQLFDGEDGGDSGFTIDSWPIEDQSGPQKGQFTLQNVSIRDAGDVALGRLMSFVPGAEIYINAEGKAIVFDGTDLAATKSHFSSLPPSTWDGESAAEIDRKAIRPKKVRVYYEREVEMVFDYEDDFAGTTYSNPNRNEFFIENVIPTPDFSTTIYEYDPEADAVVQKTVRAGTYVEMHQWLFAMDKLKPSSCINPWSGPTVRLFWIVGDLDGALGAYDQDPKVKGEVNRRIQALKQHFRQTFRINRRVMSRIKRLKDVRAALLDPVNGARAPACVWGQTCVVPTVKGKMVAARDGKNSDLYVNQDYLKPSREEGKELIETPPGPTRIDIIDEQLGIFRLEWVQSFYGTDESLLPSLLVGAQGGGNKVPTRDLRSQDTEPMGTGIRIEGGQNALTLDGRMRFRALMTVVPCAPNNLNQFHTIEVDPKDVSDQFRTEFGIKEGDGPILHVWIPPNETTSRWAWQKSTEAKATATKLLGLDSNDIEKAGVEFKPGEEQKLEGFQSVNGQNELESHSVSVAAEMLAPFADALQGRVATIVPGDVKLVGNMASVTLTVAAAPSARVLALHDFPGQQKPLSRMALLPESVRRMILGTLPLGTD